MTCTLTCKYRPTSSGNFERTGYTETYYVCEKHGIDVNEWTDGKCPIGALEERLLKMIEALEEKIDNL